MVYSWLNNYKKAVFGTTATAILQAAYQLISVPILLGKLGTNVYGDWLILNAFASYFQLADFGISSASANRMSFELAIGNTRTFDKIFSTSFTFTCGTLTIAALGLALAQRATQLEGLLGTSALRDAEANLLVWLLFGQIAVGTLANLLTGVYRAIDHYPRALAIDNCTRFAEYSSFLAAILSDVGLVGATQAVLAVKTIALVAKTIDAQSKKKLSISPFRSCLKELTAQLSPGLSFLCFPVANAVTLTGPLILIQAIHGASGVVEYSTMRTFVNVGRAPVDILLRALAPGLSLMYGRREAATIREVYRYGSLVTLAIIAAFGLCLASFGEPLYASWVNSRSTYDGKLSAAMFLSLAVSSQLAVAGTILQATNNHIRFGPLAVVAASSSLACAWVVIALQLSHALLPLVIASGDGFLLTYAIVTVYTLLPARRSTQEQ